EDLEDLFAGGAQPDRPAHVGHQPGLLAAAERQQRDGHELAHLGGDVLALAQALLVDPVVGLDEVGILTRGELPLRVDVAARFFHPRDERFRALALLTGLLDAVPVRRLAHESLPESARPRGRAMSLSRAGRPHEGAGIRRRETPRPPRWA